MIFFYDLSQYALFFFYFIILVLGVPRGLIFSCKDTDGFQIFDSREVDSCKLLVMRI